MSAHERYELLCALEARGELARDEQEELELHVADCASCHSTLRDFRDVVQELKGRIPCAITDSFTRADGPDPSRFVEFVASKGIYFSDAAIRVLHGKTNPRWNHSRLILAAAAILFVVGGSIGLALKGSKTFSTQPPARTAEVQSVGGLRTLGPAGGPEKSAESQQITQLKEQLNKALTAAGGIPKLKQTIAADEREQPLLKAKLADRDASVDRLQFSLTDARRELEEARATIGSLNDKNRRTEAELTDMRVRAANLAEELRDQKASAEQERELSEAAKEVRELMGARRLFMVDVYDGTDLRSNRSFGRVFYTEGKSLIFYAFDLDKIKSGKRVTFQAWAEHGSDRMSVRHLGDFYVDDVVQRRWVMKVTDPEKLKAVDAIFVTVEPGKGNTKPSGTKLLYAYLGGQPNHP